MQKVSKVKITAYECGSYKGGIDLKFYNDAYMSLSQRSYLLLLVNIVLDSGTFSLNMRTQTRPLKAVEVDKRFFVCIFLTSPTPTYCL